jgi:hypothetical protein
MGSDDIADLLLGLVDTLRETSQDEPIDLLILGCLTLPAVARVGLAVLNPDGSVVAHGSDDAARLQAERSDGPNQACLRTGEILIFERGCTVPMRCGGRTLGALTIFVDPPATGDEELVRIGQTLADAAATVLVIQRESDQSRVTVQQLQTALTSRIGIEQAKGLMAGRLGVGMDEAFRILREYARAHNRRLAELAAEIIAGEADPVVLRTRVQSRNRRDANPGRRSRVVDSAQLSDGSEG